MASRRTVCRDQVRRGAMADDAQVRRAVTLGRAAGRMGGDAVAAAGSSTSGWAVRRSGRQRRPRLPSPWHQVITLSESDAPFSFSVFFFARIIVLKKMKMIADP